jgi:hypothetical protein
MRDIAHVLQVLSKSAFRRRFHLGTQERAYLDMKGLPAILDHARDFINTRLASLEPPNDGRQTPMRGHPVFIAQHATAICCRTCLAKWHGIPAGRVLDEQERKYLIAVLERWLELEGRREVGREAGKRMPAADASPSQKSLFPDFEDLQ